MEAGQTQLGVWRGECLYSVKESGQPCDLVNISYGTTPSQSPFSSTSYPSGAGWVHGHHGIPKTLCVAPQET